MTRMWGVCLCCCFSFTIAAQDVVRYYASQQYPDPKMGYFEELLATALEQTQAEYGDFILQPVKEEMAQGRVAVMLQQNKLVNLMWRMTSKEFEQQLQPIYIPLLKGLMGYRIFIIRRGEQQLFAKNMPLAQLQQLAAGQGYNWPDSTILQANGFSLVQGYDNHLLKMLKAKRFDYFPRALHEPWLEIADKPEFVVEQHLMLKYQAPMFFFVNKQNQRLAQRITLGLQKMIQSGQFDQLFYEHPVLKGMLDKAQINERTVYELDNPLLSEQTLRLTQNKALWLFTPELAAAH